MATTESRSGFRLPWSVDRASLREDSESYSEGELQAEEQVPGQTATDGAARGRQPDAATDGTSADFAERVQREAITPSVQPAPAPKRPTKFLVDMIHAMQAAAEQARTSTLEQFRVEGSSYVEQIQGRSIADGEALRRRADEDVASIKDWSKAEIARVREETERRVAGRRGQLDSQLSRHAALVERDIARIEGQIASFESEMAAFFDELLAETDLTILAAHAQQMPEAPAFAELDNEAFSALLTEPAIGIPPAAPVAEPEPAVEPEPAAEPGPDVQPQATAAPEADASPAADVAQAPSGAATALTDTADAPGSVPAESGQSDSTDDAPAPAAELPAPVMVHDARPAVDPRLAMLGLTPDFAAAEAAAAEAAAAELQEIPELNEENLVARLAGLVPASQPSTAASAVPSVPVSSTQVIVTGLVSVASIASFKRHLSREAGVRHVGVSSGPDGEFLFTVQHDGAVSLRDLIPTLPGFQARVTGGSDGIVTATAHDPED